MKALSSYQKYFFFLLSSAICFVQIVFFSPASAFGLENVSKEQSQINESAHDYYLGCLEKVYDTMSKNYYRNVRRENYDRFISKFEEDIYGKLDNKEVKVPFVCWRSAAYLVDFLKDPEDTFSAFFPPKAAEKYEKTALGQKMDLGIEGLMEGKGFRVTGIEPRTDAYKQGLKVDDVLVSIDENKIRGMKQEDVVSLLTPLLGTKVSLTVWDHLTRKTRILKVESKEYYKQSIFRVPVDVPGAACLAIKSFNRKTGEDMFRMLSEINAENPSYLILDLRGNPGGPPLAARQLAGFFLRPSQYFAYFQKKGYPKAMLTVPAVTSDFRFTGPLAILVNKESGSSSELFSGVLQRKGRAILFGENTAGRVFLKSMFNYDDKSMLLLVTARGHFEDGDYFSFNGVAPDHHVDQKQGDLIEYTAQYLKSKTVSH